MLPETASSSSPLLDFWRRWPVAVRILLAVAALAFFVALLGSITAYVQADEAVMPWQARAELAPQDVPVDTIRVGSMSLPVMEPGYIVTQTLTPALPVVNVPAAGFLLGLLALVLVGYLAILPGLGWRSFLAGAGLLTFFVSTFNLDLLHLLPGSSVFSQGALLIALLLLGGTAWTLHAFFPKLGPTRRLTLFAGLILAVGALIFWRSPLDAAHTALHLVSYGTAGLLGACSLFVLWVAYENIRALLWLTGQAPNPAHRRGLDAFLVAAGLYLLNLLLLFLEAFGVVKLGGAFLNAFFVLLSSTFSGLLGLRLREAEYGRVISYLLMAPLYLLLAALTLGTLGYAFATANDPLLEAFTDGIVMSHLVFGAAFTLYVVINFAPLIRRRLRAYRVVFEPRRFPLFAVYLLGGVGLLILLLREQFFLARQFRAGYYNALGDYYRATGDDPLADAYYQQADAYEPFNIKANVSRAALADKRSELRLEQNLLRRALRRTPTEKTYAALAASYASETAFFDQQQVLHEGLREFPNSAVLNLLMGTLYARTTLTDSVAHYFSRAERRATRAVRQALLTNRLALLLRNREDAAAVRLAREIGPADVAAAQANATLAGLLKGQMLAPLPVLGRVADSLTSESFAWLTQRTLRQAALADTTGLVLLTYLASRPANAIWAADLLELRALVLRAGGQYARARAALLERAEGGSGEIAGRRYRILGLWALEDQQPYQAAEWLSTAADRGDQYAFLYRVIALAQAGQLDSARRSIPIIYTSGDPILRDAARRLQIVLTAPPTVLASDDSLLTDFVVLRGPYERATTVDSALRTIRRQPLRAFAVAAVADRALSLGDVPGAARALSLTPPANTRLRWLRAETALRAGRLPQARQLLNGPPPTNPTDVAWHQYLTGALAAAQNRRRPATQAFASLARRAPWLERGLLVAADYLSQHPPQADSLAAYKTLLIGVRYNPRSVALWQAYALTSIRLGLVEFANDALTNLARLQPADELAVFQARYDALLRQTRSVGGYE